MLGGGVAVRLIGLTGGIASGKSTVSGILRELGATVIDADALAHRVMAPGGAALEEIRSAFPEAFDGRGRLDRHALAAIVFREAERRLRLNGIVHPRVRALMAEEIRAAEVRGEKAVVLDVPLLIEGGLHRTVDEVWLVSVSEETQILRLIERNGLSREEALLRIGAQMPLKEKRRFATVLIDNEGPLDDLRQRVTRLWRDRIGRTDH